MNVDLSRDYASPPPGPRRSGCFMPTGCLVALALVAILLVGGGLYLYFNFRSIVGGMIAGAVTETITASQLPDEQKQRLIARIEQLKDDFIANRVTYEQLGRIAERIADSPILPIGMVYFMEQQYVEPSGLSTQEKHDARRTLERVARGVYEKDISHDKLDQMIAPISTIDAEGNRELKEQVTDEELRAFLKNAKAEADAAEVPDEPFHVDLADELDKAIDGVLKNEP